MYQNDPMLWSYGGKDREQTLLQEAEDYRRARRIGENQSTQTRQRLIRTLAVAALIVLWVAWMAVAG